jgi:hypothetical protein
MIEPFKHESILSKNKKLEQAFEILKKQKNPLDHIEKYFLFNLTEHRPEVIPHWLLKREDVSKLTTKEGETLAHLCASENPWKFHNEYNFKAVDKNGHTLARTYTERFTLEGYLKKTPPELFKTQLLTTSDSEGSSILDLTIDGVCNAYIHRITPIEWLRFPSEELLKLKVYLEETGKTLRKLEYLQIEGVPETIATALKIKRQCAEKQKILIKALKGISPKI